MKYLIIFVLFLSSAYAEKERGGGSLDRLLRHAGAVVDVQPKITADHDIKRAFFYLAELFMGEIRSRQVRGHVAFRNALGQEYTLTPFDFEKLQNAYFELQKKGITIHKKIESARGDPITFINSSKDMTLIVNQLEFERIMNIGNRDLLEGLGSALVGHELLSLVEIENSDKYAVSAVLAEDVLFKAALLTCINPSMIRAISILVDKIDRKIKYVGNSLAFPIDKILVNLEEADKRVTFESIADGFKVRLSQFNVEYFLDYEQARTLKGGSENFIISDYKRLWCKLSPPQVSQSADLTPPSQNY